MAPLPKVRWLVLHGLRLKGVADVAAVAAATGLAGEEVTAAMAALAADGLVERREGALAGWAPTTLGRKHDDAQVAEELMWRGRRDAVAGAHVEFLALNPKLLAACAAWQLRPAGGPLGAADPAPPAANDHTDSAYDAEVTARLAEVHRRVLPVLEALSTTLGRFAPYLPRLAHALARVQAGEGEWFTRPVLDSYHSVWFELHQDLLQTLGLERASEGECPADP